MIAGAFEESVRFGTLVQGKQVCDPDRRADRRS
jgi:hypothetical protein